MRSWPTTPSESKTSTRMALIKMRNRWYVEHSKELQVRLKELQYNHSPSESSCTPSDYFDSAHSTVTGSPPTLSTTTNTSTSPNMISGTFQVVEDKEKEEAHRSHLSGSESKTELKIDIAFVEDARRKGVHPSNLDISAAQTLDRCMPAGFQYARDLQAELCFVPPLNHERKSPDGTFILQKRGSSAVPIISPVKGHNSVGEKRDQRKGIVAVATETSEVIKAHFASPPTKPAKIFASQELRTGPSSSKRNGQLTNSTGLPSFTRTLDDAQPRLTPLANRITSESSQSSCVMSGLNCCPTTGLYFSESASKLASIESALKCYDLPHLTKPYEFPIA